ncbi:hypothetical protein NTJ28_001769 [Flavobacterium psychrophilum]|nr:hypothetical protein [Flavobacterium psychrophilum]EKT4510818.1 hypothetical protein [Flavobacterium psychrophilum]
MKKSLLIFVLFLSFSLSANAQTEKKITTKELSIEGKAKQNLESITTVMSINDPAMSEALSQLFYKKHKWLSKKNITVAEKQNIANEIDAKLRATLDYELIQKLIVKDIYKDLIN